MKHKILGLLLILSFSSFGGGKIGAYLGGSYNFFSLDESGPSSNMKTKNKISLDVAGVFHHDIMETLAIELQLGYTSHTGKMNWTADAMIPSYGKSTINFDYLYLRPLVKYGVTSEINVLGGFTFGYLTSAKNDAKYSVNVPDLQDGKASIKGISKSLRYALNLGVEYKIELESLTLVPRLAYEFALSDSVNHSGSKGKFNVLSLGVGVLF